jgi:predicted membrane channel-forming protein YqfA (hemolysin III family)
MKYLIAVTLLLFTNSVFAADPDVVLAEFKVMTDFAINVGRLVGFILFAMSWMTLKKNAENPNQYPLSTVIWGMISGLFLQIAGVLYSAFYNSFMGTSKALTNNFLALDPSSIVSLSGGANSTTSILGKMVPPETMTMILAVLYFIGVISFLKGIYLVKDTGQQNNQGSGQSAGTRAVVHMVAGFIAMHPTFFGCALEASFGFGLMCPS